MNLRRMMEQRLSIGNIKRGSRVRITGKVVFLEKGDMKFGDLEGKQFTVIGIGKETLRLKNDEQDILLTSADDVRVVKGDKDGKNKRIGQKRAKV